MRPRKDPLINFKVNDALRCAINETAAQERVSVSEFCREAVRRAISAAAANDLVAKLNKRAA